MNNKLNKKELKRNIITVLDTVIFAILLVFSSCSNNTQQDITSSETPDIIKQDPEQNQEQGIATVRMFIPDYYALANQKADRAIAPQTKTVRLSYRLNDSWVGITSIDLSTATKTPVENAPGGFTGSVYTCIFNGVPVGTYNAGNLQIELMDANGNSITSGTNATSVTIAKGGSASTTFYTVPVNPGANTGNLAAGEMKFSRAALVKGVEYPIKLSSNGDYPDLVLFKNNGQLYKYYVIDSEEEVTITITVEETDVYYLGLWADDENAIARYTLSFDFGNGTTVSGKLGNDMLHWTKENSPYIVVGDTQVKEGSELIIDAGVIIQFTGNYYLSVRGLINAQGTNENPIIFVQSGDNLNNWNGISIDSNINLNISDKYTYSSGNILKNCMIIGASNPLTLKTGTYIDSCTITSSGSVNVKDNSLLINNILDNGLYINGNSQIINNDIKSSINMGWSTPMFKNNTITNASVDFYGYAFNFASNTFNSCSLRITDMGERSVITGNNFLGYNGTILSVSTSADNRKTFNFTGNYWGEEQTAELEEKGENSNLSFFYDGNDKLDLTEIDYSNWAKEPIEGVGYLGNSFIAFDYTINGYNYENGGYYPESTSPELSIAITPQYHANDISSVRVAQSLGVLKESEWNDYNKSLSFTVDKTKLSDGLATIYVQLKDSEGNISSPVMHKVPFDNPVVTLSITDGSTYSTATSSILLNYGATDKGNLIQYELYLDGQIISREESYNEDWGNYGWGSSYSNSYTLGLAYMAAGEHTIKATFWDYAHNSTTKTVTFTINRNVNTNAFSSGFDSTTGQLLKDSKTIYLWHFDENGNEAGNNSSANIGSYNLGTGSLGGYASYAYTSGSIDVPLESAFTIEYWHKGNDYIQICKGNVFNCYFTELGFTNYCSYYKNSSGSISDNIFSCYPISDDNWHFYTFVQSESYVAVYCDGVLFNYTAGLSDTLNTNDNKLYINANNIDELRISNVARSPDEIAAYYSAAKSHIVSE